LNTLTAACTPALGGKVAAGIKGFEDEDLMRGEQKKGLEMNGI
jgi:hypothetical protein